MALAIILIIAGVMCILCGLFEEGELGIAGFGLLVLIVGCILFPGSNESLHEAIKNNSISQTAGVVTQITMNEDEKTIELNSSDTYTINDEVAVINMTSFKLGDTIKIDVLEGDRNNYIKAIDEIVSKK